MPESQAPGSRDFSSYDAMSTDALKEILRQDADSPPEQETDTEQLLYIMGILADRKHAAESKRAAQDSWNTFRQTILPGEAQPPKKPVGRTHRRVGRLVAAVSAAVLLVTVPISVKALDWDALWNIVAQWTKDTFSFVSTEQTEDCPPHQSSQEPFSSLGDALSKSNRDPSIVPVQIPNRFVLSEIRKDISPARELYLAVYLDGKDTLMIRVQSYTTEKQLHIEIAEDLTEIYEAGSVTYYIFENTGQYRAIWLIDTYECVLSGDVSLEELKMMIDSIEKGK